MSDSSFSRLDKIAAIPSSMDPISSSSTAYQPLTSTRVASPFQGCIKLLDFDNRFNSEEDEATRFGENKRGRSASPIRANVKRRRSVASAPGGAPGQLFRNDSATSTNSQNPGSRQRSPSRGRPAIRAVPTTHGSRSRQRRRVDVKSGGSRKLASSRTESIKKLSKATQDLEERIVPQLSLSEDVEGDSNEEGAYERKGAFRLKKNKRGSEFRFPKSKSQPEPLWRAGDGFTDDEASPGLVFPMTGTYKQRSRSLTGIGKLQLETENGSKENRRGSGISRQRATNLSPYEMKRRRGVAKDIWPTKENFADELEVRKRNPTVPAGEKIVPSTVPIQPTPMPHPRETFKYSQLASLKRRHSHFENFGQRLRISGKLGSIDEAEPGTQQVHYKGNSKPEDNTEYEDEEQYEAEEDCEMVPCTRYSGEGSEDEEPSSSYQESSGAPPGRESGTDDSAISIPDGEEHEVRESRQYPDEIWTEGEVAREVLVFS